MGRAIYRGIDTEYYCDCCEGLGRQYGDELILNVTVFVVRVGGGALYRRNDTACYCVC